MIQNLLLSILLLFCLSNSQIDLQTQYCSLLTNTTGEIVYQISQNNDGRTSTQFLLKTETFQVDGNLVSLSYYEDQGSIRVEESSSNFVSIVHGETSSNVLVYIDSFNQYILAKQITNTATGQFAYALFTPTLGTSGTMTKFTISSLLDSQGNDISKLSLLKILDLVDGNLVVLLSGDQQTTLYRVNTITEGNLVLQGYLSTSQKINVVGGNAQYIFASDSNTVYKSSSSSSTDYKSFTFEALSIQNVLSSSSLSIQKLGDLTLAYSSINGSTQFYPIQMSSSTNPTVSTLVGTPSFYTDNYRNFLAVTSSDLIWYRINGTTLSTKMLSNSNLNQTQGAALLTILNLAASVSFDGQSALIVTQEASQDKGSVYSVAFDPTASKEFLIMNSVVNSINLQENVASNLMEPESITGYQTSLGCNCISPQIKKLDCYANALKCIPIAGVKRQDCTKP